MTAPSGRVVGCSRLTLGAMLALAAAFATANGAAQLAAPIAGAEVAADDALTARLKHLETDLRCLVCQNQTLADSDAPLAADLRREVRELAVAGKSDDDIRAYLTARYGDFVLYNPPVKRTTWVLWFGPFVLLGCGTIAWAAILRQRAKPAVDEPGDDQVAEARGRNRLG
jgi:cytochrome c-type biogenesis protein CcmH